MRTYNRTIEVDIHTWWTIIPSDFKEYLCRDNTEYDIEYHSLLRNYEKDDQLLLPWPIWTEMLTKYLGVDGVTFSANDYPMTRTGHMSGTHSATFDDVMIRIEADPESLSVMALQWGHGELYSIMSGDSEKDIVNE